MADSSQTTGLKWADTASLITTWTNFTPTNGGLVYGNGTLVSRYTQIGKFVFGYFDFTFGSTSSIAGSSNLALPVSSKYTGWSMPLYLYKSSTTTWYVGSMLSDVSSYSFWKPRVNSVSGSYSVFTDLTATVPFTWATGDRIVAYYSYEAA